MAINVPNSYKQLVKMVAHSFYAGDCPPKDFQPEQQHDPGDKPLTATQAKKLAQVCRAQALARHRRCRPYPHQPPSQS